MKLTTPVDIKNVIKTTQKDRAVELIEREFKNEIDGLNLGNKPGFYDKIKIIISGEYQKEIRDDIVKSYQSIGWSKVEHQTSSENKERPGLTSFIFYF